MLIKKALKRDSATPVGQPGKMYIDCCGGRVDLDSPFDASAPAVECACCGAIYTQAGYILKAGGREGWRHDSTPVAPAWELGGILQ